jgi:hypothetical protein
MWWLLVLVLVLASLTVSSAWKLVYPATGLRSIPAHRYMATSSAAETITTASSLPASKYLQPSKPVFVCGGRNGVGFNVIQELSRRGIPVRTLIRRHESLPALAKLPNVEVFIGEASDPQAVQRCLEHCVTAVAALCGGLEVDESEKVDYAGNSNIVEQAGILGVERILLVTG